MLHALWERTQHGLNAISPRKLQKQAVRVATQYAPAPLRPRWRPSASRAAEQSQRSSTFLRRTRAHADRCSRLKR